MIRAVTCFSTATRGATQNHSELAATDLAAVVGGTKATKPATPVKSSTQVQTYLTVELTDVVISS